MTRRSFHPIVRIRVVIIITSTDPPGFVEPPSPLNSSAPASLCVCCHHRHPVMWLGAPERPPPPPPGPGPLGYETDWKVVCIDAEDPKAKGVDTVADWQKTPAPPGAAEGEGDGGGTDGRGYPRWIVGVRGEGAHSLHSGGA